MCGIVGIFHFDRDRPVAAETVRAMADRIVHRGPDDDGYHVAGNVGLGMRRLSIIDLAGGHQPIHTEDGRATIVFNGEVYNYREERAILAAAGRRFFTHSDTEVVLALYHEHGVAGLERLNGMFSLAIWDARRQGLLLARDRVGVKPLYYHQDADRIVFASEIKALLAHPDVRAQLDADAVAIYLRYGFTPSPHTLFAGIRKVPPAHYLWMDGDGVKCVEYWRPTYADKFRASESEINDELYALLSDATRLQMVADVPLGAFLSGGLDSSGLVHMMREAGSERTSTYSIGFGGRHGFHNEIPEARRFAEAYGTDHHEIVVDPDLADLFPKLVASLDEPLADSSFLVTYLVARLARESVKVILSGVGGDELFGGYRRYLGPTLHRFIGWLPRSVRAGIVAPLARRLPADRNSRLLNHLRLAKAFLSTSDDTPTGQYARTTSVLAPELARTLHVGAPAIEDQHERIYQDCDSDDPLDQILHFDLKTSLPEQLLMLTDKMTMAVSLEARVPYLDHRVVEFAARIPSHMKIRGFELRHVQRECFRGRLPDYVFERRKRGFGAPVGDWIRTELREQTEDLLGKASLARLGLFDADTVTRMLSEHTQMREDHSDALLALLSFQIWSEEYLH